MGMADDMRGLREDIIASHNMRVKAIGELVNDTHRTLKGFGTDRKEMSKGQSKALAGFVKDLKNDVASMIEGFQEEHKEMTDNLRESLKKIAPGLKRAEADRLKDFKDMMGNTQKFVKDVEKYVAGKLNEFADTRADMSEKLKKELAGYVAGIVNETGKLLKGYAEEREEMANNWRGMTTTKQRAMKSEAKPQEKVELPEKALKPSAKNVLEFIEHHPAGVKVGDMEKVFGIPRTRLGVIAKKLLNEGKVSQEEKKYFPL